MPLPALLSTRDLAAFLQVPVQTIYRWRTCGDGPPGIRVGRHVRYTCDAVDAWLSSRTHRPSAQVMTPEELATLPPALDVPAAAKLLGVGLKSAREMIRCGRWPSPAVKVGRQWWVPTAPFLQVLELTPEEQEGSHLGRPAPVGAEYRRDRPAHTAEPDPPARPWTT